MPPFIYHKAEHASGISMTFSFGTFGDVLREKDVGILDD
jgi:hypothetical protein